MANITANIKLAVGSSSKNRHIKIIEIYSAATATTHPLTSPLFFMKSIS
jgi:hypothetical protein